MSNGLASVEETHESAQPFTPDVRSASFADLIPDHAKRYDHDQPESGDPGDEQEFQDEQGGEEYVEEQEQEIINPQARARILTRERAARDNEIRDLSIKLDRLVGLVNDLYTPEEQEEYAPEGDEEIDPEINPVGAILKQVNDLKRELAQDKESRQVEAYKTQIVQQVRRADGMIQGVVQTEEGQAQYAPALEHLARVINSTMDDKFPNATREEKIAFAAQKVAEIKINALRSGTHPLAALVNLAQRYGWQPGMQPQQVDQKPQRQRRSGQNARADVQAARARQDGTSSLGGSQGSPPGKLSSKSLKGMDIESFNHTINGLLQSGAVRPQRSAGKTPTFSEMLPAKGVRL